MIVENSKVNFLKVFLTVNACQLGEFIKGLMKKISDFLAFCQKETLIRSDRFIVNYLKQTFSKWFQLLHLFIRGLIKRLETD